ncbi:MAG: glycosyl transferase family 2 [Nitrospirales bacterium]|nr:glycosyl transferase family 2 [Nitrospirales bacterium]
MKTWDVLLTPEAESKIQDIDHADILVGIPSFNNANTIAHVVHAVTAGICKYFPNARAVLINSDGGSTDGTPQVVATAGVDFGVLLVSESQSPLQKIVTPYYGIPGKGSAFRTIFEVARRLKVKACAVVDSDLRSITPEWMDLLLSPIMREGFDYVAPYYLRHKYDGTITNSIAYPLTRALYGVSIRQPIGGEFGFSRSLAEQYLEKHVWESEVARFGIDIWMTTEAIASGAKVCQSFLGAKIHDPKDPAKDLSEMLLEVVGALFSLMEDHTSTWMTQNAAQTVPLFGFQYHVALEPVNVNVDRMIASFQQGVVDLASIWEKMLSPAVLKALTSLASLPSKTFRLPDELWARILFDTAIAFHRRSIVRDHLLKALTPLYLGRTASFVLETQGLTTTEAEERVENLCRIFEKEKPYLVQEWGRD